MRYVDDPNGKTSYEIRQQILPNTIFFHNPPKREKFRAKSAGKLSCAGTFWNIFSDFFQHTWKSKCCFDIFPDFFLGFLQNLCAEFPPGTVQLHQRFTNIWVHDIQITPQCREITIWLYHVLLRQIMRLSFCYSKFMCTRWALDKGNVLFATFHKSPKASQKISDQRLIYLSLTIAMFCGE